MLRLFKACLLVLFLISTTTVVNSDTSWITKKSDKSKQEIKLEKKIKKDEIKKKSEWIKKKKIKNKEKFKKQKKENKSWITKKSKKETKEDKKKLKEYINIDNLPKSEFYFVAQSSNDEFYYGYVNSSKDSEKIKINNVTYNNRSDGFGYLDDGKTTCKVNSKLALVFNNLGGQVVVECVDGTEFNGIYVQQGQIGYGTGVSNKGDDINFKFYPTKVEALAQYKNLQDKNRLIDAPTAGPEEQDFKDIKPLGKYYALLIGNSKYAKWASLTSPKNDIEGVYEVLKNNYDFEKIIKVNDANRSDIFNAFQKLNKLTTDEDYVLIYYSGHGMRTENQAFWIPVEAEQEWGGGSWINTNDIHVAISKLRAKHILLLSDSCYVGNAFKGNNDEIKETQKKNLDKKFIENILLERARWFISSGGNSQVMDEVVKGHSLFAYKLIDLLKNNKTYLTSDVLFSEISKYNSQFLFSGGYNQSPVIGTVDTWGHLGGHFVFLPKK